MATAISESVKLPVPVLQHPHWRVHFQPDRYVENRIPSVKRCVELVQQHKVALRGWDFPHLSDCPKREHGSNHVASWTDHVMGLVEYWRFYQSGQFVHLQSIQEVAAPNWREHAKKWHQRAGHDWDRMPGYLSVANLLYTVTEIFEFAARLCEKEVYDNGLAITIQLKKVRGFVLSADNSRFWTQLPGVEMDEIGRSWTKSAPELIVGRTQFALGATVWFFEQFHWENPSLEILRLEQENFLRGVA